jgi:hypothetical protein
LWSLIARLEYTLYHVISTAGFRGPVACLTCNNHAVMMSRKRLGAGQLRHYFCPDLLSHASERLLYTVSATRRPLCPSFLQRDTLRRSLQKCNSTIPAEQLQNRTQHNGNFSGRLNDELINASGEKSEKNHERRHEKKSGSYRGHRPGKELPPPPEAPNSMKVLPTNELEDLLTRLSNTRVRLANAMQPLYVLLRDRRIRPDTRHYKAIIQSNSDPEHGLSKTVRKLLVEMEKYNIPVDAGPLRAALLVRQFLDSI